MEELIRAVVEALLEAGVSAEEAFPAEIMPELTGPMTAVGLKSARGAERAVYTYLGLEEGLGGMLLPVYGRELEAELLLKVFSPRRLGGRACMEEAARVARVIGGPVPGVKLGAFSMGGCVYDGKCDCMVCTIAVQARGYLYAHANLEETEFTDFVLKGAVK